MRKEKGDLKGFFALPGTMKAVGLLNKIRDNFTQLASSFRRSEKRPEFPQPDLKKSEFFFKQVLDFIRAHVAVLDESGTIQYVNQTWIQFARDNGYRDHNYGVGINYLELCESALPSSEGGARETAIALKEMLSGKRDYFTIEYPCHSQQEQRWFRMQASTFSHFGKTYLIVNHENISQLKKTEGILQAAKDDWENIFESINDSAVIIDANRTILQANKATVDLLQMPLENIIGKQCHEIFHGTDQPPEICPFHDLLICNIAKLEEMEIEALGRYCIVATSPIFDKDGHVEKVLHLMKDITDKRCYEQQQDLHGRILNILNRADDWEFLIEDLLKEIREFTQFDAVGIRLREGDDYPYFESSGFSRSFLVSENSLCGKDEPGRFIRDENGKVVLECMCGTVISGKTDSSKPFFTEGGSFWTNSTSRLLAETTEQDRQSTTRNRCNLEGYESVALIPLRSGNENIGLLQFNDKQPDRFTIDLIEFFEKITNSIGIAFERKEIQRELKESEERFRLFYMNSPLGYQSLDENGYFLEANPTWLALLGYRGQEVIGRSFGDFLTPDSKLLFAQWFPIFKKVGQTHRVAFRMVRKDGSEIDVEIDGKVAYNRDESFKQTHCVLNDVTERKKYEEALRKSEEQYRKLVETIFCGVEEIDTEGVITFANLSLERIYGYEPGEMIGINTCDLPADEQERKNLRDYLKYLIREQPEPTPYFGKGLRKGGQIIDVQMDWDYKLNDKDEVVGFISMISDITKFKRTREEKDRILTLSQDLICIIDMDYRFRYLNPIWEKILGYTLDELYARPFIEFLHPDDRELTKAEVGKLPYGKPLIGFENRYVSKDDSIRMINWEAVPLPEQGLWYCMGRDVTERRPAERLLEESQRILATLISNLPGFCYRCENDPEWTMTFISNGITALTGYQPDEVKNNKIITFDQIIHPEDRLRVWESVQRSIREKKPYELEYRIVTRDKQVKWAWEQGRGVYTEDGELLFLEGFVTDITGRKQAEEALLESGKLLTESQRISHVGSYSRDMVTNKTNWSDEQYRIFGYEPGEITPDFAFILNHIYPDDRESFLEANQKFLDGKESSYDIEYQILRKDGQQRFIRSRSIMEYTDSGDPFRKYGAIQDITERKRAEEAILQERDKVQRYLDVASVMFIVLDSEGNVTLLNKKGCEILECTEAEAVGKNWFEHFLSDRIRGQVYEQFKMLVSGKENLPEYYENPVLTKTGKERLIAWRNTNLRDENGGIVSTLSCGTDITEQKKAEQALKNIEWLLSRKVEDEQSQSYGQSYGDLAQLNTSRLLIDCVGEETLHQIAMEFLLLLDTSAAIYEANGDYAAGLFSSQWCRCLDLASRNLSNTSDNRQALIGGKWHCHESCWQRASRVSIETGKPADVECSGGLRIYAVPIFAGESIVGSMNFGYGDPPTDPKRLQQIADAYQLDVAELTEQAHSYQTRPPFIIDLAKRRLQTSARLVGEIVERRKAEQEIEKLAKFPEENPNPVLRISSGGVVFYCNQASMSLMKNLHFSKDSCVSKDWYDLVLDSLASKEPRQIEVPVDKRTFSLVFAPVVESYYVNVYGLDITELKEAEQERKELIRALESKNKELSDIVYIFSHDLKSPLININGFSDRLIEHNRQLKELVADQAGLSDSSKKQFTSLLDENIPEDLEFIFSGSDRMKKLIDGLLRVSRVGTSELAIQEIDMNKMMSGIIGSMKFQTDKAGAKILCDPLPDCVGDVEQMKQVFANLIDNSLKYLDPRKEGCIRIFGQLEGEKCVYCVEDNGIGIDEAYHTKIFEIYHRLDPHWSTQGEGLGLTIVRRILDRHNGQIRVESEPGKGSKFFVSLPCKPKK